MNTQIKTKTISRILILSVIGLLFFTNIEAQKATVGVIGIQSKGILYDAQQCASLTALELEKTQEYEVLPREDVNGALHKKGISQDSCLSRECIFMAGGLVHATYMLTGKIERFGEKVIISYKLYNISNGQLEKSSVDEYINAQSELQTMIRLSFQKLLGRDLDKANYNRLTQVSALDGKLNNPGITKLSLSGPRMGLICVTGETWKRLSADENVGGYELNRPVFTIFGYQQEIQYLNEGKFQALFEFLPMVSGLDQGRFVPSLTFMNGFRNNLDGWEVAFGPSFGLVKTSRGYYYNYGPNPDGKWYRETQWDVKNAQGEVITNPNKMKDYLDKKGELAADFSFIVGAGKTIKSGSMNLPINVFAGFGKDDYRFGITLGFNSKNKGN
ncbi:MAG: hypothetical protein NTX03_11660 [Bacteroidetes bacterium]|nr:hypothetical protein [Bacteroidota bacterium]